MSFAVGADFKDIFEVRGLKRQHRGRYLPEEAERGGGIVLAYEGLDQVLRRTRIQCSCISALSEAGEITVPIRLEPQQELVFSLNVYCESNASRTDVVSFEDALLRVHSGKKSYLLRETISGLESQLDPKKFLRIHRSAIVKIDRIKELQPWFHGEYHVILENGKQLTLSRNYRANLQEAVGKQL